MTAIGAFLKTFIYLISASLLYPVLLLLSVLCLYIIVCGGTFFAEWLERARLHKCPPQDLPDLLANGDPSAAVAHRVNRYIKTLLQVLHRNDGVEAAVENLLQQETLILRKSMDRLWLLVRVAPALGLLGTLIPMGTGLAALGQGDMTQLSADLVVAFTTTVAGLAVGTAAIVMYTIRRRWMEEDVKNMELATELLTLRAEKDKHALFQKTAN
jgi:biopolymer transport protein ExbB/TolQ